jgi:hypothetical protein
MPLLSDTERAIIACDEGERQNIVVSQVRDRIQNDLPKDIEFLREHHPDLYDSLARVLTDQVKTSECK